MVNETQKAKNPWLKPALIALSVVIVGVFGWFAYKNPQLFRAELTGGADAIPTGYTIYIPADYTALENDSGTIEVRAGVNMSTIENFGIRFDYAPTKIIIKGITTEATDYFNGIGVYSVSSPGTNPFYVRFTPGDLPKGSPSVVAGSTLFRLSVELLPDFNSGQTTIGATFDSTAGCPNETYNRFCAKDTGTPAAYITSPNFREGKISVGSGGTLLEGVDICAELGDCSGHGYCNGTACVCDPAYMGARCNACKTGFIGYPDCTEDIFSDLKGAILTLSPDAISSLPATERKKAYSSAYVIIKSQTAVGQKINIEGVEVELMEDAGATLLDSLDEMASNLMLAVDDPDTAMVPGVNATKVPGVKGVVKLDADVNNLDGTLDGISTATGNVLIVPAMENTLTLLPTASYKTRVIGVFQNATSDTNNVKDLNYTDLKWMPQPTNRLKSDALNGGLLEKGEATGKGPLYIQVERANVAPIRSNEMVVEVPSGPVIEYVRIIGSGSLERGGRANLSARVSDVDTLSDIQEIQTSIVRTTETVYNQIASDASAVWFTATPYPDQLVVTESGSAPAAPAEGGEGAGTPPPAPSAPGAKNYKIYQFPVEIPRDQNLTDGNYQLVLQISDKAGHESVAVTPIYVGSKATGDINGDGNIDQLDVFLVYQFANGKLVPTADQLKAADLNNDGKVTVLDAVMLSSKATK